jgi:hypothetical protein
LPEQISRIVSILGSIGVRIKDLKTRYLDYANNRVWLLLVVKIPEDVTINELIANLSLVENIFEVSETELASNKNGMSASS